MFIEHASELHPCVLPVWLHQPVIQVAHGRIYSVCDIHKNYTKHGDEEVCGSADYLGQSGTDELSETAMQVGPTLGQIRDDSILGWLTLVSGTVCTRRTRALSVLLGFPIRVARCNMHNESNYRMRFLWKAYISILGTSVYIIMLLWRLLLCAIIPVILASRLARHLVSIDKSCVVSLTQEIRRPISPGSGSIAKMWPSVGYIITCIITHTFTKYSQVWRICATSAHSQIPYKIFAKCS